MNFPYPRHLDASLSTGEAGRLRLAWFNASAAEGRRAKAAQGSRVLNEAEVTMVVRYVP